MRVMSVQAVSMFLFSTHRVDNTNEAKKICSTAIRARAFCIKSIQSSFVFSQTCLTNFGPTLSCLAASIVILAWVCK